MKRFVLIASLFVFSACQMKFANGPTNPDTPLVDADGGTVSEPTKNTPSTSGNGPKLVAFHIVDGTADKAWNTMSNPVIVQQHDTIRVFNDDVSGNSIAAKEIHADGTPGNHGSGDIAVGSYDDWPVAAISYDPATQFAAHPVYNHNVGPSAAFYVKVMPATYTYASRVIFSAHCISCHEAGNKQAGTDLSSYAAIMASDSGIAGKVPSNSLVYSSISSNIMPPGGSNISASDLYQLYLWIEQGAMNN